MTRHPSKPRLLLFVAVAACAALVPAAAPAVRSNVPVPSRGAYLGAYVDPYGTWRGTQSAIRATAAFEAKIGRRLRIAHHFYGWHEPFPTGLERDDGRRGRIPLLSWKSPRLDAIVSGSQDALIAARARTVRAYRAPLFIRWAWEMNGDWTEWSGGNNHTAGTLDGAAKYVAAWRRIHDIFAREGATNVSWVWAPNGTSVPNVGWNSLAAYYPGDAYIDWIGFSAYNWGTTRTWSRWSSFGALVARMHRLYGARKPLMVAETGCAPIGGSAAAWYRNVARALPRYSAIKAVVWFEQPPAWTVRTRPSTLAAFRALASSRPFTTG